jgi:CRP-like cAMP-binding protein
MRALDYQRGAWRPGTRELVGELAAAGLGRGRPFTEGQPVLTRNVPSQHVALITGGLVKVTLPSASGSEPETSAKAGILLSIRGPGEFVGEEAAILGEISPARSGHGIGRCAATGLTCGSARVFPAGELRGFLARHPALLWPIAAGLCERLADAEVRIASAAHDNADSRLARLLCDLERHGVADHDETPGTLIPLKLSGPARKFVGGPWGSGCQGVGLGLVVGVDAAE